MESVGRMTRSRAKALGTTPVAAIPDKVESKTTGRRRRGAAKVEEKQAEETAPRQLEFTEESFVQGQVAAEHHPVITEDSKRELKAEPSFGQLSCGSPTSTGDRELVDGDAHTEHDNPSVLMASPIVTAPKEQPNSANLDSLCISLDQTVSISQTSALTTNTPALPQLPPFGMFPHAHEDSPVMMVSPAMSDVRNAITQPSELTLIEDDADDQEFPQAVAGSPLSVMAESLMFSPLPIDASLLPMDASPLPSFASPYPATMSPMPMEGSPLSGPLEDSPLGGVLQHLNEEGVAPSPLGIVAVQGSPMAATTPLSFTSDAPRNAVLAIAQPLAASIPASPLSLTAEAIEEAVFSPMPDDDLIDSPISLSGAAELTPQPTPPLQQLLHGGLVAEIDQHMDNVDEMMADATPLAAEQGIGPNVISPLTFASDRMAATPGTAPLPAPAFAGMPPDSVPHASASPAPLVSSFQGFAAIFPTPAGSELEPYSPSLAGLMPANAPSPSMFLISSGATATAVVSAPSPSTNENNHGSCFGLSPTCAANPISAPSTIAAMVTPTLDTDATDGFPQETASDQQTTDNTMSSPSDLPPAPAPTPECGALSGWTLSQTPLVNALAVTISGQEDQCVDALASNLGHAQSEEEMPICSPVEDVDMADRLPPSLTPSLVVPTADLPSAMQQLTPAAAPVAKITPLQARSPAVGPVFRNAGTTSTPKTGAKASTPVARYDHIESRYNKTPNTGSTAARPRPSIATSAATANGGALSTIASGARSVKRVSIHTPEGPRSVVHQRQIVPTPFRPKSAAPPPVQPGAEEVAVDKSTSVVDHFQQQQLNSQAAAAANDRRAKATERLKAIHATEQGLAPGSTSVARPSSGPGYLAPTQAFAVKAIKTKAEASSFDARSLRQLKREVKETAAKESKVALREARCTKLTPKFHERQLPMPDDDEDSDDEAEYNDGQENALVAAMTVLAVAPTKNAPVPLRGMPAPQGRHIRFNEQGKVSESPQRTVLRGLPVAIGKYKRFE